MAKTSKFREQHQDLLVVVAELSGLLTIEKLATQAKQARKILSQFAGKLKLHLAMEDKYLYPKLLADPDPEISSMAQKFIDEMGNIGMAVKEYLAKWPHEMAIKNDAKGFIQETQGIIEVLGKRIEREDNCLYELVDNMD